jgi:MFS family permease
MSALSIEDQKAGMRHAIIAACFGSIGPVLISNSSVIILYANLLGVSETVSLVTTSLQDCSKCLLMIPFAYIAEYIGHKRMTLLGNLLACIMLFLCASAGFFPSISRYVLLGSLAGFSISIAFYLSSWFPLLSNVVPEDMRGTFFGKMRFTWQLFSGIILVIISLLVGKSADLITLQAIVAFAGILYVGRLYHLSRIKEVKSSKTTPPLRSLLSDAISNKQLVGFSIYLLCLYMAANATIPVTFIFAKNSLKLADNIVVVLSALLLTGLIIGYLAASKIVDKFGVKGIFLCAHMSFGILNFMLLAVKTDSLTDTIILGSITVAYGFFFALASIAVTSEVFNLAPENNKGISMAFCLSFYSAGLGGSRFLASLILGSGLLSPTWQFLGMQVTKYHTMFLFYGCAVVVTSLLMVLVPSVTKGVHRLPNVI